jgi:hypothetical protein
VERLESRLDEIKRRESRALDAYLEAGIELPGLVTVQPLPLE